MSYTTMDRQYEREGQSLNVVCALKHLVMRKEHFKTDSFMAAIDH